MSKKQAYGSKRSARLKMSQRREKTVEAAVENI
jgi:hypothetical protein